MKLAVKTIYGLKALLEMAMHAGHEVTSVDISKAQKIPVKFLEQILTVLKRGKIIESSRGREGGYSLLKEPKEITLYALIELMEGAVDFTANIKKGDTIINRIKEVENKLIAELKKITVEDLIEEKAKETGVSFYNI